MLVELVKAIFEYGLPGAAILLALVAAWIVRDALRTQQVIVTWIKEREAMDAEADENRETRLAEERKAMFDLVESIMDRFHERYAELVTTLKSGMADLVQSYQQGIAEISAQVAAAYQAAEQTMSQVQTERAARFDQIDSRFDALDAAIVDVNEAQTKPLLDKVRAIEQALITRTEAIETLLKDRTCAKETGELLALLQDKLTAVHGAVNQLIDLSKDGREAEPAHQPKTATKDKPTEESNDRATQSSTELPDHADRTGGGDG